MKTLIKLVVLIVAIIIFACIAVLITSSQPFIALPPELQLVGISSIAVAIAITFNYISKLI